MNSTAKSKKFALKKHTQELLANGWTQEKIAKIAGCSQASVHRISEGHERCRYDVALRILELQPIAAAA